MSAVSAEGRILKAFLGVVYPCEKICEQDLFIAGLHSVKGSHLLLWKWYNINQLVRSVLLETALKGSLPFPYFSCQMCPINSDGIACN